VFEVLLSRIGSAVWHVMVVVWRSG